MKKLVTALALLLSSTAIAQPDKDWWACQSIKSGGLKWEDGQWKAAFFKTDPPFVLVSDGNGSLTKESVSKAFGGEEPVVWETVECRKAYNIGISCTNIFGQHLVFDPATARGGKTALNGATVMTSDYRDAVTADVFECAKG